MFNNLLALKDKYPDITLVHCELAWIEDARNHFLQDKYIKDCEWMLWWDNDVIVTQAQTLRFIKTFTENLKIDLKQNFFLLVIEKPKVEFI